MLRTVNLLILLLFAIPRAQFPDEIVLGPGLGSTFCGGQSLVRLSSRIHVPGDIFDIEADFASVSLFADRNLTEDFGVSWVSLVWLPLTLLGKRFDFFTGPSVVLQGMNCVLNPTASMGNTWMRGFVGWKTDIFIWREFLWVFDPMVGCKFALPRTGATNSSIRAGISFPARTSTDQSAFRNAANFRPNLYFDFDIYIIYADVELSRK